MHPLTRCVELRGTLTDLSLDRQIDGIAADGIRIPAVLSNELLECAELERRHTWLPLVIYHGKANLELVSRKSHFAHGSSIASEVIVPASLEVE